LPRLDKSESQFGNDECRYGFQNGTYGSHAVLGSDSKICRRTARMRFGIKWNSRVPFGGMMKYWLLMLIVMFAVGCANAESSSGWTDDYIATLSKNDCKGIASGDKNYCSSRDCKGLAKKDANYCETSDCKGVAKQNKSYCASDLCKAWASGNANYCNNGDCKGIVKKDKNYCSSRQCKAIATGDKNYCP